jgi:peptidoglycan/xylan/chitin deacetylase (PgdA/CDA1 family)
MRFLPFLLAGFALCALLGMSLAWQSTPAAPAHATVKPLRLPVVQDTPVPSAFDDAQLKELHVNEAGRVPILEYHEIGPNPSGASRATRMMHRSIEEFQGDLQRLYEEGYRPVNLSEYLDNKMNLPVGTSPVVLTFDDARSTQFRYLHDGSIDPNCAVGILQDFTRSHPDFPLKAVFYVLPDGAFGSDRYAARKMRALLQMGCELGNHTLNHHYFNRMSDAAIEKEIALGKRITEKMVPGANLDTLALPGGCKPRSHNYGVLTSGAYEGTHYTNRAVLDAWGGPAPSPISTKYDPLRIPRVLGVNGSGGVNEALDYLKERPGERYVSDGDPNTVTVPMRFARLVKTPALRGLPLHTYDDGRKSTADSNTNTTSASATRHRHKRHHAVRKHQG